MIKWRIEADLQAAPLVTNAAALRSDSGDPKCAISNVFLAATSSSSARHGERALKTLHLGECPSLIKVGLQFSRIIAFRGRGICTTLLCISLKIFARMLMTQQIYRRAMLRFIIVAFAPLALAHTLNTTPDSPFPTPANFTLSRAGVPGSTESTDREPIIPIPITIAPTSTSPIDNPAVVPTENSLETELSGILPFLWAWVDHAEERAPSLARLERLREKIEGSLSDTTPKPTSNDCGDNLFSLLSCISVIVSGITGSISGPITPGAVAAVEGQLTELEKLTKQLDDEQQEEGEKDEDNKSSTSTESCTESSVEAEFTTCSPSPITSGDTTTTTIKCATSTETVSGCSITAQGSATTLSASASATALCGYGTCGTGCDLRQHALPLEDRDVGPTLQRRTMFDPDWYPGGYGKSAP